MREKTIFQPLPEKEKCVKHVFECKICRKVHGDRVKALECCAPENIPGLPCFACPQCETMHSNEHDARYCCDIEEKVGYVCERCDDVYDNEHGAKWCRCRLKSIFICPTCSKEHTNILAAQTCHTFDEVTE